MPTRFLRPSGYPGDCWPTANHELLLRAALTRGEESIAAWQAWRERTDVEALDGGSHGLLPLLSRSLEQQGVHHLDMRRYVSVYKRVWARNQLLMHRMVEVLELLHEHAIRTMILKGAPLLLAYYKDLGARAMNDFDILVPTGQAGEAIQAIEQTSWQTPFPTARSRVLLTHSVLFEDGPDDFDLHWHVMEECCLPDADAAFWTDADDVSHQNVETRMLNATDQLLHVIVHGLRWAETPPIRWVADSMTILGRAADRVDWDRLMVHSERCGTVVPLRYGLDYLAERFAAPIPQEVLARFADCEVPRREVVEFRVKARKRTVWRRLLFHWFNYQRLKQVVDGKLPMLGFLTYLQQRLAIRHWWQIPRFVLTKVSQR